MRHFISRKRCWPIQQLRRILFLTKWNYGKIIGCAISTVVLPPHARSQESPSPVHISAFNAYEHDVNERLQRMASGASSLSDACRVDIKGILAAWLGVSLTTWRKRRHLQGCASADGGRKRRSVDCWTHSLNRKTTGSRAQLAIRLTRVTISQSQLIVC